MVILSQDGIANQNFKKNSKIPKTKINDHKLYMSNFGVTLIKHIFITQKSNKTFEQVLKTF